MMVQSEGFVLRPGSREIQQVHALQLHLLSEVDRLCRAHGIHYYLLFGTLLGAVRHAGFIPWDDDVDIGVKRDDYDRLLDLLELELDPERYFIQTAANDAGITIPFAKVRCQKTIFEEYNAPVGAEYHQGVFLDIFPLDNVPDDDKAARRMKLKFLYYHFSLRRKVEGYRSNRWYVNLLYSIGALHDIPTLLQKRHRVMTSCQDDQTFRLIAMPSARVDYDESYVLREQMDPPIDIDFCGRLF
ncbi:MAG TPA: LicD family protein, partial [Clostridiaceae bacterium]|nr:LicD family protein [Clostridiaceae bacterium]